jgi:hypothetical protein
MHLSHDPDDPRPRQRERIRHELDRFLSQTLRPDIPRHLVLAALVAAARQLHQHIELDAEGGAS